MPNHEAISSVALATQGELEVIHALAVSCVEKGIVIEDADNPRDRLPVEVVEMVTGAKLDDLARDPCRDPNVVFEGKQAVVVQELAAVAENFASSARIRRLGRQIVICEQHAA